MYDTILVPTDGSAAAGRALEEAIALASETGATLHVLYVVDTGAARWSAIGDDEFGAEVQQVLEYLEREGETATDDLATVAEDAGVEVVTAVEEGTPHRCILEYAADNDVDVVVMGTHGRRGLDRFILGSTTERVVRTADIPVLTVRYEEEDEADG
jgi:nucleotide-binding universal stress UspA family protein